MYPCVLYTCMYHHVYRCTCILVFAVVFIENCCLQMLLNLHKKSWVDGLMLDDYNSHCETNEQTVKEMLDLAKLYNKALEDEESMTAEQLAIKNVGKQVYCVLPACIGMHYRHQLRVISTVALQHLIVFTQTFV